MIQKFMVERSGMTLPLPKSGSPHDCKMYLISLIRSMGSEQFFYAIVAFNQEFKRFLKQNAGLRALGRACLQVKEE